MADRAKRIDTWSPLSYKPGLADGGDGDGLAPSWVGDHARRLSAYKLYERQLRNTSRDSLDPKSGATGDTIRQYREYGDPKTFRDAIVSALLGYDPPAVIVEGADDEPPDDAEDAATRIAAAEKAKARQDELRAWDTVERAGRKLYEGEQHAVGLGDGVWLFQVDGEKRRVTVEAINPGFYFPVYSHRDGEFPRKVHVAWQFEAPDERGVTIDFVYRQTWELSPLTADDEGVTVHANPIDGGDPTFVREYVWNRDAKTGEVAPSPWTCRYSASTWKLADISGKDVYKFAAGGVPDTDIVTGAPLIDVDLAIDFLPIVHEPNTPAGAAHYGESCLANVAQIHDELALNDTDSARSAAITGTGVLAASGIALGNIAIVPGTVLGLGEQGKLYPVDTSVGLKTLMERESKLLDRRDANGRVPSALLGRVDPAEIQAGIILSLSFGPLRSLIGELNLVRDEKHPLFWKIVQRLSIAAGYYDDQIVYPATFARSSFLPTDDAALVAQVTALFAAKLISRSTAIQWLQDSGFSYDSAKDEVGRIEAEDYDAAEMLKAVLGDGPWVDEILHRNPEDRQAWEEAHPAPEVFPPDPTQPPGGPTSAE